MTQFLTYVGSIADILGIGSVLVGLVVWLLKRKRKKDKRHIYIQLE